MVPLFAALADVHKSVNYLKKPSGATIAEQKQRQA
jgi:hypothetical protein